MDGDLLSFALLSFSSLVIIINPLGATLTYISLTTHLDREKRNEIATDSCRYALMIILVFALFGGIILSLFGISLEAFKIAGGILLFGIGMEMVYAKTSRTKITATEKYESMDADDIVVVPLAFPMISGPGAITTVIVLMNESAGDVAKMALIIASSLLAILLTYLMMGHADAIGRRIREREYRALNRLMGMLLIAIAIQFVITGIQIAFPGLGVTPP